MQFFMDLSNIVYALTRATEAKEGETGKKVEAKFDETYDKLKDSNPAEEFEKSLLSFNQ